MLRISQGGLCQLHLCTSQYNHEKASLEAYPNATAEANASPKAADFPLPRAAVNVTVLFKVFSDIASINFRTAFA